MSKVTLGEFAIKFESHEQRDIDRFETTTSQMNEGFKSILSKLEELIGQTGIKVQDHEIRIRKLEKSTWSVIAIASACAAVIGWLSNALGNGLHL